MQQEQLAVAVAGAASAGRTPATAHQPPRPAAQRVSHTAACLICLGRLKNMKITLKILPPVCVNTLDFIKRISVNRHILPFFFFLSSIFAALRVILPGSPSSTTPECRLLTAVRTTVKTGATLQIAYHLRLHCFFIVWILDLCCLRLNKDSP
jgi:hypothetical protein